MYNVSYLPQRDRASAFVVERVKIFLVPTLITVQNLVAVFHTVCPHLEGYKNWIRWGPRSAPWDAGRRNMLLHHVC